MSFQNIAIVGANGHLGPYILSALRTSSNKYTITVLSRSSSKSTYPSAIKVKTIADSPTHADLVSVLRGADALILAFAGGNRDQQILWADAAREAGVKRLIPADFGSCDSGSTRAVELLAIYRAKAEVREHLKRIAGGGPGGMSWTSLVCGHMFDYGLECGLLKFDMKGKKATIFDGGEVRWSTSTLAQIGRAAIKVLEKGKETEGRMLYIQSFCVSQNQVLAALEKATGQEWAVEHVSSDAFIDKEKPKADEGDAEAIEDLVGVLGIVDGNWESKDGFAMEMLGLDEEDLQQVVNEVVGKGLVF